MYAYLTVLVKRLHKWSQQHGKEQKNFKGEKKYEDLAKRQLAFMNDEAAHYPAGYAMFLMSLSDYIDPPEKITMVFKEKQMPEDLSCRISLDTVVQILDQPSKEYPLINDRTTYYICRGRSCQPPVNELGESV